MAFKFNNNQVNTVLWNGTKTTTSVNETVSGIVRVTTTATTWTKQFTTAINTSDLSQLKATITATNSQLASVQLSLNSVGCVVANCTGISSAANVIVEISVTITGSCITYTGKVNKIMFDGNLVYLASGVTLTDLTGSTWKLKDTLPLAADFTYNINFTSNAKNFTQMGSRLTIDPTQGSFSHLKYINASETITAAIISTAATSWMNNNYKTIKITGGTDATNATLISWLYANATLVI